MSDITVTVSQTEITATATGNTISVTVPETPTTVAVYDGAAATVEVGTVTTGEAASITNSGTAQHAVLDFVLEAGPTGATGPQGATGPAGSAATITVGTVTVGTPPAVVNSGTSSAAVLDFTLPDVSGDVVQDGSVTAGNLAVWASDNHVEDGGAPLTAEAVAITLNEYGPNLIVNGAFDADATGWTVGTGWAWESDGAGGGWMRHTAGNTAALSQGGALASGIVYTYGLSIGGTTGSVTIAADDGDSFVLGATDTTGFDFLSYFDDTSVKIKITPSSDFDGYVDTILVCRPPVVQDARFSPTAIYGRKGGAWVLITGASGTFTTADAKTVTVTDGLITSIV